MVAKLWDALFGCWHLHYSFPITVRKGQRRSRAAQVTGTYVVCLDCGKSFSMIKRHISTDHKLSPAEYRQRWGLPVSYPMVAPNYAKVRSALAKKIGLGRQASPTRTGQKRARKKAAR